MNWFKHDTDALSDAKVKKLILRHGAEGYAVYFHCLELIAGDLSESNITFELEHDAEIIADNLKIKGTANQSGVERVNEIMLYILELGLFEENSNRIFCFKLLKRLDLSMTSSVKMRQMITDAKENHDAIMTDHDFIMQDKNRIDKIRKEERVESASAQPRHPALAAVDQYFHEIGKPEEAENFFDYFSSNGWKVSGKAPMKDWQAAARNWARRAERFKPVQKETKEEMVKRKLKAAGIEYDG